MKKKRSFLFWVIVLFVVFMYSMGIYDFPMMLSHNANYYASHGYGSEVVTYFTNYPIYFLILWITNLFFGFLAPIVLIFNARIAKYFALISVVADTALLIFTFAFRDRLRVLGVSVAIFDILILLMTFGFYMYCRHIEKVDSK